MESSTSHVVGGQTSHAQNSLALSLSQSRKRGPGRPPKEQHNANMICEGVVTTPNNSDNIVEFTYSNPKIFKNMIKEVLDIIDTGGRLSTYANSLKLYVLEKKYTTGFTY